MSHRESGQQTRIEEVPIPSMAGPMVDIITEMHRLMEEQSFAQLVHQGLGTAPEQCEEYSTLRGAKIICAPAFAEEFKKLYDDTTKEKKDG